MEISRLENEMKYVEINGCTLSVDERMRIDLGCCELINQIKSDSLQLWGKIRGKSYKILNTLFRNRQGLHRRFYC